MMFYLDNNIEEELLKTKKKSTVETYKRQLKCFGLSSISKDNLRGNIKLLVDGLIIKNYVNSKIYINALLNVYKYSNYDVDELEMLKNIYIEECFKSDIERKENKAENNEINYSWNEVQRIYLKCREKYFLNPSHYNLTNWLIASLYSDESFGIKRTIDIINLKKKNIVNDEICFIAEKNKFSYESGKLSKRILKPLTLILKKIIDDNDFLILTINNAPYTTNNFLKRLKDIFGEVNSQEMRKLWASYKYSQHPDPKELLRHAYELNHDIKTHLSDYVMKYDIEKIIWIEKIKFKKHISYVRC